jgi:hypothetical protein
MKTLQSFIPKVLVKHHIAGAGLGALMIDHMKEFCSYPGLVSWYLRNNILFLSLDSREDKLSLVHKKTELIVSIQELLKKFGYCYVLKDIRIK